MISRFLALVSLSLIIGCAVPKDQDRFAIQAVGTDSDPFISSQELLVSGLVSESLSIAARGRLFDAESRLRRALVLDPGNPSIRYNLAVVLGQQGHFDEALKDFEDLRRTQGPHPIYAIALGDLHAGKGDLERARIELKRAYEIYYQAQNWLQAALVARSISNLAFAAGNEQEALCYSYEAFSLDASAAQFGYHTSLLVALNQYKIVDTTIAEQVSVNSALGAMPRVHLARALARGALGNSKGALEEVELAQNLAAQDPELGSEINVVWWLLRNEIPLSEQDKEDKKLKASIEAIEPEVLRFQEKPPYAILRWPRYFTQLLEKANVTD
jgi:Flp pilus assembly protein TadD